MLPDPEDAEAGGDDTGSPGIALTFQSLGAATAGVDKTLVRCPGTPKPALKKGEAAGPVE